MLTCDICKQKYEDENHFTNFLIHCGQSKRMTVYSFITDWLQSCKVCKTCYFKIDTDLTKIMLKYFEQITGKPQTWIEPEDK